MITEYQIANFKAFGSPQTLPIRPITLIFGPNSSGKSSIFQSLLMLKQTIETQDKTDSPLLYKGNLVDLGGPREFVHKHDEKRELSFRLQINQLDFEKYVPETHPIFRDENQFDYLESILKFFKFAAKKWGLQFNFNINNRVFDHKRTGIFLGKDKEPLIIIERDKCININIRHLLMKRYENWKLRADEEIIKYGGTLDDVALETWEKLIDKEMQSEIDKKVAEGKLQHIEHMIYLDDDDLEGLPFFKYEPDDVYEEIYNKYHNDDEYPFLFSIFKGWYELGAKSGFKDSLQYKQFFPMLTTDIGEIEYLLYRYGSAKESEGEIKVFTTFVSLNLMDHLKDILYLGPMREWPVRYFYYSGLKTTYVGKTGKNVPDMIITNPEILDDINKWFRNLEIHYVMKISPLSEQDTDIQDVFSLRLFDKDNGVYVGLTDVGFGLSQILPVIVQSVASQKKTILIEQPEYHLHPRLQAELGDMFIESALGEQKNTFLIETHSEHLILRIMRRMRETYEGMLPEGMPPVKPEDVAVVYVEKDGDQSIIREMPLNERGELVKAWPGGFFEEGLREVMA